VSRYSGERHRKDLAIVELARRLYEAMDIEDPHEDKPWDALNQAERDFYVSAIRQVLSWEGLVLAAIADQPHDLEVDRLGLELPLKPNSA
jgi:hypothetical protein